MELKKHKKGKISTKTVTAAILTIITIVILFSVYSELVPEAQDAGTQLNDTNTCKTAGCTWNETSGGSCYNALNGSCDYNRVPLNSLFGTGGIIFLIIMVALLITIVLKIMPKKK